MLRESTLIGAFTLARTEVRAFTDKQIELVTTFADQAVIAIENVRLFTELQEKNQALTQAHAQVTESLEQQTATSEILRVISQSPTDVQPVFDTIAQNVLRLCNGVAAGVFRFDGQLVHLAAVHNLEPEEAREVLARAYPMPPNRENLSARAILDRATVHAPDLEGDSDASSSRRLGRATGSRSVLAVPMLREGIPIGVISVGRAHVGPFSDRQIELVKTFADQAVIAIENVRLFNETKEALEQQTATSEILRVISSSPTDVQPVFDAIAAAATTLCAAESTGVFLFDGTLIHFAAHHNWRAKDLAAIRETFPRPPGPGTVTARAILTRAVAHVADIAADPEYAIRGFVEEGFHAILSVPMLRDSDPIGAISVTRREAVPFTDKQVALLQTFADQAVIAIENVRLFKELQARTGELTRSVEQLTALGEVSRAVSSTLDIEAVLDTIVSRASELAGDAGCAIYEYDESSERFELRAAHHYDREFVEALRASPLRRGEGLMGRAAEMHEPVQIPDIMRPGAYESSVRNTLIQFGYRALLSVPLLREEQIIGSLSFNRKTPGEFSAEVVDVLKTFATQSALAIQNARLFREIEEKSRQLEVASQHKSEFLANMSHELRTPLNAIIGFSEVLTDRMFGELNEKQEEYLKDIYASGTHLLSLINDILDLSKIEAGRMELELSEFDLPTALDNAVTLVRERAARHGISLHKSFDERLGQIHADERKVRQVVLNLLSNAIKFTPEGGRIEVLAAPKDGSVEISVSDTGVGIAPEDQETVFEEFRQVGTAAKKIEGTGLGLTLCRKFVELHGGRIWVKSELGVGSTFTFTIPVWRDE
jgi:signal transduction histidine kinase